MRMRNAVDIGIKYEKKVLEALQTYGLKAYRTNQTNIHDPKGYKHGFAPQVAITTGMQEPPKPFLTCIPA